MAAANLTGIARAAADAAPLLRRKIPSSGEELPVIGLGTSGPFEVDASEAKRARTARGARRLLRRGRAPHRHLTDVFHGRGRARGPAHAADARDAFLATKVWTRGQSAGVGQMTRSAQLLKTARLDLIQVHNLLDLDTQLKTLRAWKESGRVRYVGVTHYTVGAHADLARVLAAREARLRAVQLLARDTRGRRAPPAAGRRARRGGARQPAVRGRRSLPPHRR